MDTLSKERRSWNMSRIQGMNTKPEIAVRSLLHQAGLRFRTHDSALPGRPDVVLKSSKIVVFVHGCFWHRHKGCAFAYTPKSNSVFWTQKFDDTILRDRRVLQSLRRAGWESHVVWECQLGDGERMAAIVDHIMRLHRKRSKSLGTVKPRRLLPRASRATGHRASRR